MTAMTTGSGPDSTTTTAASDAGLGLLEIVVSMLMLGLLAIALVPMLVAGMKVSANNTTLATATQLVAERIQLAQAAGPVCANVAALGGTTQVTDPRGVVLEVTTITGLCSAGARTLPVSASVVRLDTVETISSASTLVYLGG